jgi:hypothetical protein
MLCASIHLPLSELLTPAENGKALVTNQSLSAFENAPPMQRGSPHKLKKSDFISIENP